MYGFYHFHLFSLMFQYFHSWKQENIKITIHENNTILRILFIVFNFCIILPHNTKKKIEQPFEKISTKTQLNMSMIS